MAAGWWLDEVKTIIEDQDEDASKNERAAIAKPNRYWYRNGNLSVYK
uniref:Uncharacterized protein n=1 Tax=Setaria italica TaxID=4555 RepID=K3XTR8_SETIT